jgi:plasmid stabilization system protein ParE
MEKIYNFVNNEWRESAAIEYFDVINPTTNELLARTPLSLKNEVDEAGDGEKFQQRIESNIYLSLKYCSRRILTISREQ